MNRVNDSLNLYGANDLRTPKRGEKLSSAKFNGSRIEKVRRIYSKI